MRLGLEMEVRALHRHLSETIRCRATGKLPTMTAFVTGDGHLLCGAYAAEYLGWLFEVGTYDRTATLADISRRVSSTVLLASGPSSSRPAA